ncbi:MAG: EFR1 family ferrodoxin [Actinomycetia bacterium]|nr:EFR1 family ferrodoxin [Actinomycetes bacterium]
MNASTVFWFSGTGNSLYAAKELSAAVSANLVRITSAAPSGAFGGDGSKVGFVFPSYYGNLPRTVREFVGKLDIKPETYIFAVVTMGGPGQGSIAALEKVLAEKNLKLSYGRGIFMPANYIIKYNPMFLGRAAKAGRKIQKIAGDIKSKKTLLKKSRVTADTLYQNIEELDRAFSAGTECTGCGLCVKLCPIENIRLDNGKPQWRGACEHCVACINWCPSQAIEYGDKTHKRRRYHNPQIKEGEMMRGEQKL